MFEDYIRLHIPGELPRPWQTTEELIDEEIRTRRQAIENYIWNMPH